MAAAKSYYAEGLERGDYYAGQELPGIWHGKAAAMLGLSGEIDRDHFHLLCENIRPDTFGKLNPREDKDRKVGYDFTFSAPKSVSILQGVVGDARITEAFRRVVRETMEIIETDAHVRVRIAGVVEDRKTGNLVWGEFTHFTSRAIDSISDPQLHCHCYAFNTSFDAAEQRFKAGEFFHIKRDAPYYEAIFHSKLAMALRKLGYGIENQRYGFEVRGVGKENIERFSRRAHEIEELAEELGIQGDKKAKDGLAARTRQAKNPTQSLDQMRTEWVLRLERESLTYLDPESHEAGKPVYSFAAVDLAIEGGFERKSVVPYRRLVAEALQQSLGDCRFEAIAEEMATREELVSHVINGQQLSTTTEVIREEKEIIEFLDQTRGTTAAIDPEFAVTNPLLDENQSEAVEALLRSRNRVFVIEGRAGTGKTTLMREAVDGIELTGIRVYTFAPTSEASHKVLKAEGFDHSETIQQLLVNESLQRDMRDAVIWVDEAGLLSSKEMNQLLQIADQQNARVVLSGDTRQHRSVERGDGLRLIVESHLVEVYETQRVHRQKVAGYRMAVEHLSRGELESGFDKLEELGAIHEFDQFSEKVAALAEDYVASLTQYSSVLVVSPTHRESELVTDQIRTRLVKDGALGNECRPLVVHRNRNLTMAQRKLPQFMSIGDVVKFHQNAPGGIRKGSVFNIVDITASGDVLLEGPGGENTSLRTLDVCAAKHYQIYKTEVLEVRVGDRLRVTQNTMSEDGARLYNGSVHTVAGFSSEGDVILAGGHVVRRDAGILDFGYVSTSHASQGKTSGKVIISQGRTSSAAASLEQFYVSVSRGRDAIAIYADDKFELLEDVRRTGERMLAKELLADRSASELEQAIELARQSGYDRDRDTAMLLELQGRS